MTDAEVGKAGKSSYEPAAVLGVSLSLVGAGDIKQLIGELEFGDSVVRLDGCGDHHVMSIMSGRFQTLKHSHTLGEAVLKFRDIISSLSATAKLQWDALSLKEFRISILSGIGPRYFETVIEDETVAVAASLGVSIRIAVYPPYRDTGDGE